MLQRQCINGVTAVMEGCHEGWVLHHQAARNQPDTGTKVRLSGPPENVDSHTVIDFINKTHFYNQLWWLLFQFYTVSQKIRHSIVDHIVGKCRPIFGILSMLDSKENFVCIAYTAKIFHLTCTLAARYKTLAAKCARCTWKRVAETATLLPGACTWWWWWWSQLDRNCLLNLTIKIDTDLIDILHKTSVFILPDRWLLNSSGFYSDANCNRYATLQYETTKPCKHCTKFLRRIAF